MKFFSPGLRVALMTPALGLACAMPAAARPTCGPEALGVARTLTISRSQPTAVGIQTYPRTLDLADHEVVLTFDDGPAAPTAKILDALAAECARATFFVIGHNAAGTPALVKRAADEGHTIGHHSYSHPGQTLRKLSEEAARADIDRGIAATTAAAGGVSAPFFRFPGFADTPALLSYLQNKGFTVFGSDVWASDWNDTTPEAERDLILARLEKAGKGILLFHDSKLHTAQMLPEFLKELKKRGFRLVHLVPGDGETPVVAAGADWTSTTEPIIARTLGGAKTTGGARDAARKAPRRAPGARAASGAAGAGGAPADGGGPAGDTTNGGEER
jgi:peptidoglycan/xylan/chitin deacetylase (PgdA/CDA1 family)